MNMNVLLMRLQTVVYETEKAPDFDRALLFGFFLVLVDTFIARSPTRRLILRFFNVSDDTRDTDEAHRLVSQTAAKLVGAIFLLRMFPLALEVLFDPHFASDKLYATSPTSLLCMIYASGYFLYDIFICTARYSENGPEFLLHGTLCFLSYLYPILSGHLHYFGASFLMWELSTPFLYARWVALKKGLGDSKMMPYMNFLLVLVFFSCRVVYGPYTSYEFWRITAKELVNPRPNGIPNVVLYLYRTAMITLNGLNYTWFIRMVSIAAGIGGSKKRNLKKKNT